MFLVTKEKKMGLLGQMRMMGLLESAYWLSWFFAFALLSLPGMHTHTRTRTHTHNNSHTHTHSYTHAHARRRAALCFDLARHLVNYVFQHFNGCSPGFLLHICCLLQLICYLGLRLSEAAKVGHSVQFSGSVCLAYHSSFLRDFLRQVGLRKPFSCPA